MAGGDWILNLTGNLGTKSAEEAAQVGKLSAAMKAEEAALKRLEVARLRAAAGNDRKAYGKAIDAELESKAKLAKLTASLGGKSIKEVDFLPKGGIGAALLGGLDAALIKGAKLAAAGMATITAVTLAGSIGLATFGARAADAARSSHLLNEAADIAGGGGHKLDGVIRQVANDVPLAKEQIAGLARELSIARLSGREAQLALGASAVASSALGDAAGSSIVQIATQSRAIKRFTLGAKDLYREYTGLAGTGLKNADVIGALAKQLKTSLPAAEAALRTGRVKVEDGLAALEAATKTKFGGVVARQMLSLDVQTRKLGEHLGDLFSDVNAEPALKGLHDVLGVFDSTTFAGATLKQLLTAVFSDLSGSAETAASKLKSFFLGLESGALDVYIALKPILSSLFTPDSAGTDGISSSFKAGEAAAKALGTALADVLQVMTQIGNAAGVLKDVASIIVRPKSVDIAKGASSSADAIAMGAKIDVGIAKGIADNQGAPVTAMIAVSNALAAAFSGPRGIDAHSPSKVFEARAAQIPAGAERGVRGGIPDVEAAVIDMGNVRGGGVANDNRRSVGDVNISIQALGDAAILRIIDTRVNSILMAVAGQGAQ